MCSIHVRIRQCMHNYICYGYHVKSAGQINYLDSVEEPHYRKQMDYI